MTAYNSDAAGALTTALISGADGLVSLTAYGGDDPFTAYQLFNPHGDSEAITDTGGNVLYSSTWDAFGNAITGGGLSYGYSAKYLRESDYLTGYTRMGVRDYDPALGRFTSVDPLKGDPYNPQSRNRYGYALNDPLTIYDLDGRKVSISTSFIPYGFTPPGITVTYSSLDDEGELSMNTNSLFYQMAVWGETVNHADDITRYNQLTAEHNRFRTGADGNGAKSCENGTLNSGYSDKKELSGFHYVMLNEEDYEIGLPSGETILVSQQNPYLWDYVIHLNSYQGLINIIGSGGIIITGLSFHNPLEALDTYEVGKEADHAIVEFQETLKQDFDKARRWEIECNGRF